MNHKNEITQWVRICPTCGGKIYHQSKQDRNRREREGRNCGGKVSLGCKIISKKQREQTSASLKGKRPNHDQTKRRLKSTPTQFIRSCPSCKISIYYSDEESLKYAIRDKTLCGSCTAIRDNVQQYRISDQAKKQMRATKAGFKSWKEYCKKFPIWKRYKAEVWSETYKQLKQNPPLENFDKRGKCGVDGAYQIDHIIGVREGFDKGIDLTKIGAYSNLRMIPWRENLLKG